VSEGKRVVLDANILLRAVFGVRVRGILDAYEGAASIYSPDVCFDDARKYIPTLAAKRNFSPDAALTVMDRLDLIVECVDYTLYKKHETSSRDRISSRYLADWPIMATALLLNCPIWTEDQDFFGSGVATWTTNKVELYLRNV